MSLERKNQRQQYGPPNTETKEPVCTGSPYGDEGSNDAGRNQNVSLATCLPHALHDAEGPSQLLRATARPQERRVSELIDLRGTRFVCRRHHTTGQRKKHMAFETKREKRRKDTSSSLLTPSSLKAERIRRKRKNGAQKQTVSQSALRGE